MDVSVQQVVWEEGIDWKECIKIIWKEHCIELKAKIRILLDSGSYYLEIDAFGQRWRYNLTASCFTFYEFGIARFKICAQPNGSNGARIALEGCIGVSGIEKCWTIFAQDIVWFNINDIDSEVLDSLEVSASHRTSDKYTIFGSISSNLDQSQIDELLAQ